MRRLVMIACLLVTTASLAVIRGATVEFEMVTWPVCTARIEGPGPTRRGSYELDVLNSTGLTKHGNARFVKRPYGAQKGVHLLLKSI
jgi:hypothetical protein